MALSSNFFNCQLHMEIEAVRGSQKDQTFENCTVPLRLKLFVVPSLFTRDKWMRGYID